jgi:acetyl-CoA carboxylase biotin carboxyl carrier protein
MNIIEIKELIQAVVDSGVAELEVQRGDNRVRVVRGSGSPTQEIVIPSAAAPEAKLPSTFKLTTEPEKIEAPETNAIAVKSPIVGTFYSCPSPGAEPFVKVGDLVSPGQVLCIVESMKLMNEIESEISGTVIARHVENGAPVEYGATLFTVRPH